MNELERHAAQPVSVTTIDIFHSNYHSLSRHFGSFRSRNIARAKAIFIRRFLILCMRL